jgi:hypothetical protein
MLVIVHCRICIEHPPRRLAFSPEAHRTDGPSSDSKHLWVPSSWNRRTDADISQQWGFPALPAHRRMGTQGSSTREDW